MVTVGDDPLLGVVVEGRYKIESIIGQGSAGTVYRAIQELIGREVAIKVLHDYLVSDKEFIARFTQEAKASSRLSHPNIITIYDFGQIPQVNNRPYIAMDLLKGTPLSDMLSERNHLSLSEALPLFKQVCGALAEAHRQGVVHRDIKPENIVLVERSGQKLFPIIVDFGIARLVQEESGITRTGTVCGSPTYMSPEQCTSSKVDHRSDIYSLGIVLYEALSGEVPFLSDELVKVMAMHLSDPPKPLSTVRKDLQFSDVVEGIVLKALQKNPDKRYQTMEEFADALDRAAKMPEAPPALVSQPPKRAETGSGPLASDEDLRPAVTRSATITGKDSGPNQPVNPFLSAKQDLASRALDELRTSGAYSERDDEEDIAAKVAAAGQAMYDNQSVQSNSTLSHVNFKKGRVSSNNFLWYVRKYGLRALALVFLIGVISFAVLGAYDPHMLNVLLGKKSTMNDIDTLYKEGKYDEVISIVKDYRSKNQNKLPKASSETYARALYQEAKSLLRKGDSDDYDQAILLLKAVPPKTSQSDPAQQLIKKSKR